jgi:hypothetical protein
MYEAKLGLFDSGKRTSLLLTTKKFYFTTSLSPPLSELYFHTWALHP